MDILILARGPDRDGGVVNLVNSVKAGLPGSVMVTDFIIGARQDHVSTFSRYLQSFADTCRLFKKVRSKRYDVVHINPSLNVRSLFRDGLFMLVLRLTRQRVLVFFHGWDEALSGRICDSRLRCWLMRATFGSAARILVLAGRFREQLVSMGLERDRIFTITTMFDGALLADVRVLQRKPGRTVLFLSRFVREKGLFELLGAFARIAAEFPDARMVMAGDGPVREQLEQAISHAGMQDRIELPGYLRGKDKVAVLAGADIFALPSYGEGCPVSMLEAMAAGLAVISTPVGGIPDILHNGENGVLLSSPEPEQIYAALHKLMSSPGLLASISATNHEVAWRCYESGIVTKELERHYRECGRNQ